MKKGLTEMVFILDRSGSMTGLESDTIGGFNSTIKKQKQEEGEAIVTTILFDSRYEVLHDRFDISQIGEMTEKEYFTRGSTALLDAMGSAIQKTVNVQKNLPEKDRAENVIFVIITDGYENSSCEYSYEQIKKMVEHQQEKYDWEFLFLGANIDVVEEASRLGIRRDRAARYVQDDLGTEITYRAVSDAVSQKRSCCVISDVWADEINEDYNSRGNDE